MRDAHRVGDLAVLSVLRRISIPPPWRWWGQSSAGGPVTRPPPRCHSPAPFPAPKPHPAKCVPRRRAWLPGIPAPGRSAPGASAAPSPHKNDCDSASPPAPLQKHADTPRAPAPSAATCGFRAPRPCGAGRPPAGLRTPPASAGPPTPASPREPPEAIGLSLLPRPLSSPLPLLTVFRRARRVFARRVRRRVIFG